MLSSCRSFCSPPPRRLTAPGRRRGLPRHDPSPVQAASALQGSSDPELAPLVTEARSLPESLVAAARVTDDHDILSTTLSVVGQYWWQIAKSKASPDKKLLKLAETCLAEAAYAAGRPREGAYARYTRSGSTRPCRPRGS